MPYYVSAKEEKRIMLTAKIGALQQKKGQEVEHRSFEMLEDILVTFQSV